MNGPPAHTALACLAQCIAECSATAQPLALLHLDVDGLGRYALTHGQLGACGMLRALHDSLSDLMQPGDLRTRYGEQRVLVALPGRSIARAQEFAERARLRLEGYRLETTVSIGIVQTGPQHYASGDALIDAAQQLVFRAKSQGGGRTLAAPL